MNQEMAEPVDLKRQHRALDTEINKANKHPGTCPVELKEMKLQRLRLKEQLEGIAAAA